MIRLATLDDTPAIAAMLRERAAWMQSRGIEPWKPDWFSDDAVTKEQATHDYVLRVGNGRVLGCYRLQWRDDYFWPGDDAAAGYVHRLCVAVSQAGHAIGRELLDDFERRVLESGRALARLDCWADNAKLVSYYESAGFGLVDVVRVRGNFPAARFEKRLKDFGPAA